VTNEVLTVANPMVSLIDPRPYHSWMVGFGHSSFGLMQWEPHESQIYIFSYLGDVPFSAPVVAAAFTLILLLLLVPGYYLISNLRHKSAPDRDKLD